MLKYALTLCVLIPIILAQSQESSSEEASISGSHSLFKIYPKQSLQVEFLKKYAIGSGQSNGPQSTRAQIITPLAAGKTSYALVPISSSVVFTQMLRRKHIKSKFVDVTTINSFTVDNSMHEPSEFPPPRRQSHYNQLQLRDPYPEDYIIQSPRITNKGAWGLWATCVTNSYAIGFILKTQQLDKTVDNTALNAIKLLCAPYPQLPADQAVEIQSLEGDYGDWGRKFTCPKGSHANAFQLRSEQEGAGDGDDSGANNFKVFLQ